MKPLTILKAFGNFRPNINSSAIFLVVSPKAGYLITALLFTETCRYWRLWHQFSCGSSTMMNHHLQRERIIARIKEQYRQLKNIQVILSATVRAICQKGLTGGCSPLLIKGRKIFSDTKIFSVAKIFSDLTNHKKIKTWKVENMQYPVCSAGC